MIAVSIILFIVGCVLGYVLSQLQAARKGQAALVETERVKVELTMLQQQKAEQEQRGQTLQQKTDALANELSSARAEAVSLHTALTKEQEQRTADNARLATLQKEYETTRHELTTTLAELARCKTELQKEQEQILF